MRGKSMVKGYRILDSVSISRDGITHIAGDPMLDTWAKRKIGTVSEELPLGAFDDALASFWNPVSGRFDLASPPNVDLGDEVGVALYGENTGSETQSMYMSISIFSPSGTEYFNSSVARDVYPGAYIPFYATQIADKAGEWTAKATLYGEVI